MLTPVRVHRKPAWCILNRIPHCSVNEHLRLLNRGKNRIPKCNIRRNGGSKTAAGAVYIRKCVHIAGKKPNPLPV